MHILLSNLDMLDLKRGQLCCTSLGMPYSVVTADQGCRTKMVNMIFYEMTYICCGITIWMFLVLMHSGCVLYLDMCISRGKRLSLVTLNQQTLTVIGQVMMRKGRMRNLPWVLFVYTVVGVSSCLLIGYSLLTCEKWQIRWCIFFQIWICLYTSLILLL